MTKNSTKFDEKLLNEREFLIRNCLETQFIGSDGNISDAEKTLNKQQQLLNYIDDDILNESKC